MSVVKSEVIISKHESVKNLKDLKRGDVLHLKNPADGVAETYVVVLEPAKFWVKLLTISLDVLVTSELPNGVATIFIQGMHTLQRPVIEPEVQAVKIGNLDTLAPFLVEGLAGLSI